MRYVLSLLALFLVFGVHGHARAAQECRTAQDEIAGLPENVQHKVIEGAEVAAFKKAVGAPFPDTFTYVIHYIDQRQYEIAVVAVFDDEGCLITRARLPKAMVKDFISVQS